VQGETFVDVEAERRNSFVDRPDCRDDLFAIRPVGLAEQQIFVDAGKNAQAAAQFVGSQFAQFAFVPISKRFSSTATFAGQGNLVVEFFDLALVHRLERFGRFVKLFEQVGEVD